MVAQFVNIEVGDRSALGSGGLARHKRTATRDQHTTEGPRAGTPAVHLVDEVKGTRLALEAIEADKRRRAGKRGRPPGGVYNALFTGAPRYDGSNGTPLTPEQELAWAKACVEWVRERAPDAIIAAAILHRDEASPHLHLTLVPRYQPPPEKGEELEPARLDWRAVRAQLAGRAVRSKLKTAGLSKADIRKARANDKKEAQKDMVALLDSVHDQVMAPYGIERAITGEGKRRVAVDRRIAAELEAQGAEAAAERARERARKEAAAATEATERRRTAEQAQSDAEIKQRDRARKEAAAATEATERRRIAEQAQSDAEIKQRDREKKEVQDAENTRRAELDREEEARNRLQRLEDAIAAAGAGRLGKNARRGKAILEAKDAQTAEVLASKDEEIRTIQAELDVAKPKVAATAQAERERDEAVTALKPVTTERDTLRRQVDQHPAELEAAESRGFAAGLRVGIEAIGRYGAALGGRAAHVMEDLAGWIRTGADDQQLTWPQDSREQARDRGQGLD